MGGTPGDPPSARVEVEVEVDTPAAMIECIRREISFRERVYPRWVQQGKLASQTADLEMARMRAVLVALQKLSNGAMWQEIADGFSNAPPATVGPDVAAAKREGAETVLRMIPSSLAVRIQGAVYRKLGV